ncbi:MAG: sulfur carrier protein ThiS [Planctomycetota bacterium]
MKIVLNGRETDVEAGTTVGQVVDGVTRDRSRIAVERNGEIVGRATYDTTPVAAGDVIEIVMLVGGG